MEDPFINADYITNGFTKFGNEKFYQMSNDLVFKLILICFIGPFLEELVFRKMILGYLDRNFTSIVLSSFLFALIHVFNGFEILKVFSSFFFGIILGIVYYKGGLIYSILIHVFYNLLFFVSNYLCNELYEQILLKLDFGLFYWIILILSAIFFSIILFKYFLPITKLNESSIIIN
ncbi:MAG: CPBP family intramembrane metalloprotease [Flavobacteriaceae bacterium]|nr:CPBP family intramembrane metalloprotease [Flavobacteriaceae bacterium]